MKKLLALFKNRLFYIFLNCILVISAIMLPSISTTAFAIFKDPHTSIWPGGLGGDARTSIKVYIADYTNCTEEVDKFANISSAGGNDAVFTFNFAKKKISAAPSSSTSYNNIDYIIYMVRELEKLAEDYLLDINANEEDYTPAQTDINNLVLGYIRGILPRHFWIILQTHSPIVFLPIMIQCIRTVIPTPTATACLFTHRRSTKERQVQKAPSYKNSGKRYLSQWTLTMQTEPAPITSTTNRQIWFFHFCHIQKRTARMKTAILSRKLSFPI